MSCNRRSLAVKGVIIQKMLFYIITARFLHTRYIAAYAGRDVIVSSILNVWPFSVTLTGVLISTLVSVSLSRQASHSGLNEPRSVHFILVNPLLLFKVPGILNTR